MFSLTSRNITSAMRWSQPTPVQQWSVFFSSHGDFCAGKDSSGSSEEESHSQKL